MEPPEGEETNKKDAAAADDLRELAAKGVCAPLWRTSQPVQPVRACLLLLQGALQTSMRALLSAWLLWQLAGWARACRTGAVALPAKRACKQKCWGPSRTR